MEKENLELQLAVLLSTQAHTNAGIDSSFPRQREHNSRRSGRKKKSRSESKKSEDSSDSEHTPIPTPFSYVQAANRSFPPAPASSGRNEHSNPASNHQAPFSSRDVQRPYPFFPQAPTSLGHNEDPNSAYYGQEMQSRHRTHVYDHYPNDQYTSRSSSSLNRPSRDNRQESRGRREELFLAFLQSNAQTNVLLASQNTTFLAYMASRR
jgi:hypothetical protein